MYMRVTTILVGHWFILLQFVAKTYLYGPVQDKSCEVIKKAIIDYSTKTELAPNAPREVRYQVTPDPETADADDNFGFNELTRSC